MRVAAALGLFLVGCSPAAPPEGCRDCLDVQGTYHFVAPRTDSANCEGLYFSGADHQVFITQHGSRLDISEFTAEATLLDDLSISLPSQDIRTSTGAPGTLLVTGAFSGEVGHRVLSMSLFYTAKSQAGGYEQDCDLQVSGSMTQVAR